MFRAFNLSSKYGRSKAEKILLTYQTIAISVKVPTPYTTQPPCHNCVARLGVYCQMANMYAIKRVHIMFMNGWLVGWLGFKVVIITNLEQKQKSA